MNKAKRYSFLVLRIGISLVFLWFGFSQIKNPSGWIGMIPSYAKFIPENLLIYSNGIIEIILSVLILTGYKLKFASFLLGLHLLHLVTIVGYGSIGARDLALAFATFSIFLNGPDELCLDKILKRNK